MKNLDKLQLLHRTLTERQDEVFLLIAKGLSNKEIASVLGIAARTAESHRERIMIKFTDGGLKEHGIVVLAHMALHLGLIENIFEAEEHNRIAA
jgi:DNA-binding CsgD family transcriptional regulator